MARSSNNGGSGSGFGNDEDKRGFNPSLIVASSSKWIGEGLQRLSAEWSKDGLLSSSVQNYLTCWCHVFLRAAGSTIRRVWPKVLALDSAVSIKKVKEVAPNLLARNLLTKMVEEIFPESTGAIRQIYIKATDSNPYLLVQLDCDTEDDELSEMEKLFHISMSDLTGMDKSLWRTVLEGALAVLEQTVFEIIHPAWTAWKRMHGMTGKSKKKKQKLEKSKASDDKKEQANSPATDSDAVGETALLPRPSKPYVLLSRHLDASLRGNTEIKTVFSLFEFPMPLSACFDIESDSWPRMENLVPYKDDPPSEEDDEEDGDEDEEDEEEETSSKRNHLFKSPLEKTETLWFETPDLVEKGRQAYLSGCMGHHILLRKAHIRPVDFLGCTPNSYHDIELLDGEAYQEIGDDEWVREAHDEWIVFDLIDKNGCETTMRARIHSGFHSELDGAVYLRDVSYPILRVGDERRELRYVIKCTMSPQELEQKVYVPNGDVVECKDAFPISLRYKYAYAHDLEFERLMPYLQLLSESVLFGQRHVVWVWFDLPFLPFRLFIFGAHMHELFCKYHPKHLRISYQVSALEIASQSARLTALPKVVLELIAEYAPADLPVWNHDKKCFE